MKCIVATLGFDAANVLRPLLALGLEPGDKLVLVTSSIGGEYEKERTRKAVQEIESITGRRTQVLSYRAVIDDLPGLTASLADHCSDAEETLVILSGGLRPLILLTLSAALITWRHRGKKLTIISMREDGLAMLSMEPEHFSPPELGEREREVLEALEARGGKAKRKELVKSLMEKWGTSHVIVYRRLNNLEKKKLIQIEDQEVKLLPLGKAILEALKP